MSLETADRLARIAGDAPRLQEHGLDVVVPRDEVELAAIVWRAGELAQRLVPMGLGTHLAALRPDVFEPEAPLGLSTRAMDGIVSYVPGDGTLTARAGATLGDLKRAVAEGGHRLTPDVAAADSATLGGVVAGARDGIDRLQRGPVRHHVLGARIVLADGTRSMSGGRLVKNVTGFDLHRLWTGSRGTYGVLTEISLRLFPLPEHELFVGADFDTPRAALDAARALFALPITPVALVVETRAEDEPARLSLALEGFRRQLASDLAQVTLTLDGARVEVLEGADARASRGRLRELAVGGGAALRLTCTPSRARDGLESLLTFLRARGASVPRCVVHPSLAVLEVFFDAGDELSPEAARDLASRLAPAGIRCAPRRVSLDVHRALAHPGRDPGAARWMAALRAELDPQGLFAAPYPARA